MSAPPAEVLAAWGWAGAEVAPILGGLINATFAVRRGGEPVAVLQRLHRVFAPEVNLDLEAVTAHLAARGLETPLLLRARDGAAWVEHEGAIWRALTWVDGVTVHTVPDLAWAAAGGALVGRFHRAVADLAYDYRFTRAGVHDTAAHLAKLEERLAGPPASEPWIDQARALGAEILEVARALPALPATPLRHCHGDLKISNLRFTIAPVRATCLLDLDTLGRGTLAFELGDGMRSWGNPGGEDRGVARFDPAIFAAAMTGWREVAGDLATREELASVVAGLETVCVELAARFCVDVFDDAYFGWDPARFGSRREHDLVRARGQLALALSVREQRADLLDAALSNPV